MSILNYPSSYDQHDKPHENADNHVESHIDMIDSIGKVQEVIGLVNDKNSDNLFSRLYAIENSIKEFNEMKERMVSSYADKLKLLDKKISKIDKLIENKVKEKQVGGKQFYSEICKSFIQTKKEHTMSIPLNKELVAEHSGLYRCEIVQRHIKKNEYTDKIVFIGQVKQLIKGESLLPTLYIKPTDGGHETAIVEYEVEVLFYKM